MPTPFLRRLMARLKVGAEYSLELLQKHFARLNLKAQPHSPRMLGSVQFRLQFSQLAEEGLIQPFLPEQVSPGGVHQSPLCSPTLASAKHQPDLDAIPIKVDTSFHPDSTP